VVEVRRADVKQVKIESRAFVSEENLKNSVSVEASGDEGTQTYRVKGPKVLLPGKCLRVDVRVTIPESVKELEKLRIAFISGSLDWDESVKDLKFQSLVVAAVQANLRFEPTVNSESIAVDIVTGNIEGKFHGRTIQAATVNGDVDGHFCGRNVHLMTANGNVRAKVNVDPKEENKIMADTIRGDVELEVTKNFEGSFSLTNIKGHTCVKGKDVEFEEKKKHRKVGKHIPGGEDANDKSTIKIGSISGNLSLKFGCA
jgi:hypothetical protein